MATAALTYYTPEEYLAIDRMAEFKSEYIDGRSVAMTGAQRAHIIIVHNLDREIGNRLLDGPCEVYPAEMRVKINASGRYVYPDLSVACDPVFEDGVIDTLLNPVLIIEVLSDSTEAYDRGDKFLHYRRIDALREYVLVSQNKVLVECYARDGKFWRYNSVDGLDGVLTLASAGLEIPLNLIYHKVFDRDSASAADRQE